MPPAGAAAGLRAAPRPSAAEGGASLGVTLGAAAALAALLRASSRRRSQGRARSSAATRRAEADIEWGTEDPETGEKNYVNPWEQYVEGDLDLPKSVKPVPTGWKFHSYGGPVYKKVPVAEGLEFPLDPKLYYPPLEPPPVGAKWGDGRSPDGNWYMDIEGEKTQYWQGWGRRKTACAIVRLIKGNGQFIINNRDAVEYFQYYPMWWLKAAEPMAALSIKNDYDCLVKTFGGGKSGQAGAIRLAMARAMQEIDFNWRPLLKKAKYLTRDYRMVESKKTGRHKARKKKPYHKR